VPQRLRIFVSSPSDVPDERLRTALVVDKLSQDYSRFFSIETYRWEHEAMLASAHFQDAIEPPSDFDIVVLILWSRLGTPLPEKTAEREYRGIDGRAPVTGTEWEYEEALKVAKERKAPDLLAFRDISPAPIDPRDPDAQAKSMVCSPPWCRLQSGGHASRAWRAPRRPSPRPSARPARPWLE
jgi:hypothetical protein